MGKRKKKGKGGPDGSGYAQGATWRDVLRGKPVTVAERKKRKAQGGAKRGRPPLVVGRCVRPACGAVASVKVVPGVPPDCPKCGGGFRI